MKYLINLLIAFSSHNLFALDNAEANQREIIYEVILQDGTINESGDLQFLFNTRIRGDEYRFMEGEFIVEIISRDNYILPLEVWACIDPIGENIFKSIYTHIPMKVMNGLHLIENESYGLQNMFKINLSVDMIKSFTGCINQDSDKDVDHKVIFGIKSWKLEKDRLVEDGLIVTEPIWIKINDRNIEVLSYCLQKEKFSVERNQKKFGLNSILP